VLTGTLAAGMPSQKAGRHWHWQALAGTRLAGIAKALCRGDRALKAAADVV
jgi:hypothetical protein